MKKIISVLVLMIFMTSVGYFLGYSCAIHQANPISSTCIEFNGEYHSYN